MPVFPMLDKQKFDIVVAREAVIPLHGHDFLEFSYVTKGRILHTIDETTTTVSEGEYFIVDHGTQHSYKAVGDAPIQVVNLLFYPEFADRTLIGCKTFEQVAASYLIRFSYKALNTSPTGKTLRDKDGRIGAILQEILREYTEKRSGYLEYIRCLFLEILLLTMRKIGKNPHAGERSETVEAIIRYVTDHYAQSITLSALAAQHNYSLSHLSKKFAAEMGIGFADYLQQVRLEQSCRLLQTTDNTVLAVAEAVGYSDVRFFNRIFKAAFRLTPREFRRSYRL